MKQIKIISMALATVSLTALSLSGCGGTECGAGTTEENGECVANETPANGDTCGEGTELVDGVCKSTGGGSDLECGEGTEAQDGICVPQGGAECGPKTTANDQGRCIIDPAACSSGELLDPNSGDCTSTDTFCSSTTAFDADSGTCVPTEDVCDAGTSFDAESGLCLPDACQEGDVLVNGVCSDPAEELAANADLTETENNDPTIGGTAEALTVKDVGETTVFTGAIGEPTDLDGDGSVDQDRDSFTIEATAGQWFQLSVQSTGLPTPGFIVEGPEDFERYSPIGRAGDTARQLALPYDGTYTVTVVSSLISLGDGDIGPAGSADWTYVGSLEQIDAPTATDIDLTADAISGSYEMLTDNYFKATGFEAGDLVTLTVDASGDNADGRLAIWASPTELATTIDISEADSYDIVIPQGGELTMLVDWVNINGPDIDFEISGQAQTDFENIGILDDDSTSTSTAVDIAGGDSYKYTFSVNAGQVIELAGDNADDETIDLTLSDANGSTIATATSLTPLSSTSSDAEYGYWYTQSGGTFTLSLTADDDSVDLTDATVQVRTLTPTDLGDIAVGDTVNESASGGIALKKSAYYKMNLATAVAVTGDLTAVDDDDIDLAFVNPDNSLIAESNDVGAEEFENLVIPTTGEVLVRVIGYEATASYELNMTFAEAPQLEVEPNDTNANASPIDDLSSPINGSAGADEIDVFSFTLADDLGADEVFITELAADTSYKTYRCTLRDSSGADVGTIDEDGSDGGCLTLSSGLVAGETYYLEIEQIGGFSSTDYAITTRTETGRLEGEDNGDNANATSIDLDTFAGAMNIFGNLASETDTDVFTFTLPSDLAASNITTFSLERLGYSPTSEASWSLVDDSDTELASGALGDDLSVTALTAGTYYVKLERSSTDTDDSAAYRISATSATPVCGNGTVETGETCDDGNTDSGDGCTATCQIDQSVSGPIDADNPVVTRVQTISSCSGTVSDINVDVDITHAYRADIDISLTSPDGTTVVLFDVSFDPDDDVVGNFPADLTPNGSLDDFAGVAGNGDWTLTIEDAYPGSDDGTFNSFGVNLTCQ